MHGELNLSIGMTAEPVNTFQNISLCYAVICHQTSVLNIELILFMHLLSY